MVNRPNYKDYTYKDDDRDILSKDGYEKYVIDLNKYCDELEKAYVDAVKKGTSYSIRNEELNNALDKACECLEGFGQACADCPQCCVGSKRHGCQHCEKEDWKEWCLGEVSK